MFDVLLNKKLWNSSFRFKSVKYMTNTELELQWLSKNKTFKLGYAIYVGTNSIQSQQIEYSK